MHHVRIWGTVSLGETQKTPLVDHTNVDEVCERTFDALETLLVDDLALSFHFVLVACVNSA